MKRSVTAMFLLMPMISALAQDTSPPKEVRDLGWMVGTWSGSGKMAFGGHETEIATTITVSFEGQFLKAFSTDKSSQYTTTKTTMTGWDAAKGQYTSYSFTNFAPTARVAHGKLDGSKLEMTSDPWGAEGMTMVVRETMSKISDSSCGLLMEFKNGDKWDKAMDYVLTKK